MGGHAIPRGCADQGMPHIGTELPAGKVGFCSFGMLACIFSTLRLSEFLRLLHFWTLGAASSSGPASSLSDDVRSIQIACWARLTAPVAGVFPKWVLLFAMVCLALWTVDGAEESLRFGLCSMFEAATGRVLSFFLPEGLGSWSEVSVVWFELLPNWASKNCSAISELLQEV